MEETVRFGMVPDRNVTSIIPLLPEKGGEYDLYHINGYSRENIEDMELLDRYFEEKLKPYAGRNTELYVTRKTTDFSLIAALNRLVKQSRELEVYFWDRDNEVYHGMKMTIREGEKERGSESIACVLLNRHDIGVSDEMTNAIAEKNIIFFGNGLPGDSLPAEKMFDFDLLSKTAASSLGRIKTVLQQTGGNTVRFYLCGLKPLTVIALNEAKKLELQVECMHWNMDKESYFLQKVNF